MDSKTARDGLTQRGTQMTTQTIYLSCAPEDWAATQELRDALTAASQPFVAQRPGEIKTAWCIVACFSAAGSGAARYQAAELLTALAEPHVEAGRQRLFALKLQPCRLPALPGDVATIESTTDWAAVVKRISPAQSRASATAAVTGESLMAGNDINVTAAELGAGSSAAVDAHLDVKFKTVVADRDANFTARKG